MNYQTLQTPPTEVEIAALQTAVNVVPEMGMILRRLIWQKERLEAALKNSAPFCFIHKDVKMTYADGTQPYHDVKEPHWRCELWIGSGVCGKTRPL